MKTMERPILGSHDTMSYLPVRQWYLKPFFWTARCQNKTLWDQYCCGAQLFDIRIRFTKSAQPIFAHGPIEFKGDVLTVLEDLDSWAQDGKVYMRIILESNSPMKDQDTQELLFQEFCEYAIHKYTNIIFFGGNRKYDWKEIYKFDVQAPSLDDKYSSTTELFGGSHGSLRAKLDDIFPWLYARLNNKKNIKKGTDKDCLLIDFVGAKWNV